MEYVQGVNGQAKSYALTGGQIGGVPNPVPTPPILPALPAAQDLARDIEERLGGIVQRLDAALNAFGAPRPAQVVGFADKAGAAPMAGLQPTLWRIQNMVRALDSLCTELI